MAPSFNWPLGKAGHRVLVVLGADADLLAPILDGEAEPEDGGIPERLVPLGIPDFDVSPEELAHELAGGPRDVWLVLPYSDAVYEFHAALAEAMDTLPSAAFLPESLTLKEVVEALPWGREAVGPGRPTRHQLLKEVLKWLWVANAPDDLLAVLVLRQAAGNSYPEKTLAS